MINRITYYTSPTCAPCKKLLPQVEQLCDERGVTIDLIDITAQPDLAQQAGVMQVPTVIVGDTRLGPQQARKLKIRDLLDTTI